MTKRPFRSAVVALLTVAVVTATSLGPGWGRAGASAARADTLLAPPTLVSPTSPSNAPGPQWSFAGVAGSTFECRLTRPDGTVVVDAACTSPKRYDLTLDPDGTYAFDVRQRDPGGSSSDVAASSYLLDRQPPGLAFTSVPDNYSSDLTPTWTFTSEPGATFYYELYVADPFRCPGSGPCVTPGSYGWISECENGNPCLFDSGSNTSGTYTYDFGPFMQAGVTLVVAAQDAAGNYSAGLSSIIVDNVAYPPTFQTRPDDVSGDSTPTWTFTGEPGASFACTLARAGATGAVDSGPCNSGSYTIDLGASPDDTYTLSVTQTDILGHTSVPNIDSFALARAIPTATAGSTMTPTPTVTGTPATAATATPIATTMAATPTLTANTVVATPTPTATGPLTPTPTATTGPPTATGKPTSTATVTPATTPTATKTPRPKNPHP